MSFYCANRAIWWRHPIHNQYNSKWSSCLVELLDSTKLSVYLGQRSRRNPTAAEGFSSRLSKNVQVCIFPGWKKHIGKKLPTAEEFSAGLIAKLKTYFLGEYGKSLNRRHHSKDALHLINIYKNDVKKTNPSLSRFILGRAVSWNRTGSRADQRDQVLLLVNYS